MPEKDALVGNAADEKQVKRADLKERDTRRRELEDIKVVLSTRNGRRFYWRYLNKCGIFSSCYVSDSRVYFNEGMRNIGILLVVDLNEADPEAYLTMMAEARADENT